MYISRLVLAAVLLCAACSFASARNVWGLVGYANPQTLVRFDDTAPGTIITTSTITGVPASEILVGIDVRPFNGLLYAASSAGTLYLINPDGSATNPLTFNCSLPAVSGSAPVTWTVDFNPVADALRLISDGGLNYRVAGIAAGSPVCFQDGSINPTGAVIYAGTYSSNFRETTATILYGLGTTTAGGSTLRVGQINPPNAGTFTSDQGATGISINPTSDRIHVDSYRDYTTSTPTDVFIASVEVSGVDTLYKFTTSGAFTSAASSAQIGDGSLEVVSISAALQVPFPFQVAVLSSGSRITTFRVSNPTAAAPTSVDITGAAAGDSFIGIALRPANSYTYGLTNTGALYILYPSSSGSYTAYFVALTNCTINPTSANEYSIDFNPVADALRVVSSSGENYRVNPTTGVCLTDGPLNPTPQVAVGVSYTNSTSGAASVTQEYTITRAVSGNALSLNQVTAPNAGTTVAVGPITPAISTAGQAPLDILTIGTTQYYYVAIVGTLYSLDRTNAASTAVAVFNSVQNENDLAGLIVYPTAYTLPSAAPTANVDPRANVNSFLVGVYVPPSTYHIFNSTNLGPVQTLAITLPTGVIRFHAISLRPSTGYVYAVGSNNVIYILYPTSTTVVTAFAQATLSGCALNVAADRIYSIDFNPVADLLRIVSNTGENYRVNVTSGACTVDGTLFYADGSAAPNPIGVSYTNSINPRPTATAEYIVDSRGSRFSQVTNPNGGNTTARGALGFTPTAGAPAPIDIVTVGSDQLVYTVDTTTLRRIDLATGAATTVGTYTATATTAAPAGVIVFPAGYTNPVAPGTSTTTTGATTTTAGAGGATTNNAVSTTTGNNSASTAFVSMVLLALVAINALLM